MLFHSVLHDSYDIDLSGRSADWLASKISETFAAIHLPHVRLVHIADTCL